MMEMIFTIGIMAFLGVIAFFALGLPKETIQGDVLGASGFPLIVLGLCFLLCVLQLARQAKTRQEKGGKLIDLSSPSGRAIAFSVLTLAGYIAVLNILGFIISTPIFALTAAIVMGYRKKAKLIVFAVLMTLGLFLLFGKAFFVPLPRGIGFFKELSYLLY